MLSRSTWPSLEHCSGGATQVTVFAPCWISIFQITCDKLHLGRKGEWESNYRIWGTGTLSSCSHLDCTLGCLFSGGPLYVGPCWSCEGNAICPYTMVPTEDPQLLVHREQPLTIVHPIPWRPIIWIFCRKKRESSEPTSTSTHTHNT